MKIMLKKNFKNVKKEIASLPDGTPVDKVHIRWLIDKNDGAQNYAMRMFEIEQGGSIPLHQHPEEHEMFILKGKGALLKKDGQEVEINEGDVIFVPSNEIHGYKNIGNDNLVFICVIPYLKK